MVRLLLTLMTALTLAGCAGLQRVDNTVQSYARWDAPAGTAATGAAKVPAAPQRYRFERLLSQRDSTSAEGQDRLEAMARQALEPRGWTPAATDADARWTVQVTASTVRVGRDPWNDPWGGWRFQSRIVAGNGHVFFAPMFGFPMESPGYQRQVALLIREAASGRVGYETRADHESRWNSTPALWQAMVEAALAWLRGHPDDPVDLLVTDQNMPGLSGIDVVRELRSLRPVLRVAIVSGHVNERLIAEAAALGVTDVLGKQDSMDALGDAIRAMLPLPGA